MDPRKHSQAQSVFWDNSPSPRLLEFRKVTADHIAAIQNVAVDLNIIAVPLAAILIIGGWRDEVIHPDLVFLVYKLLINLIGARGILLCLIEK